jgi:hypothetical protein
LGNLDDRTTCKSVLKAGLHLELTTIEMLWSRKEMFATMPTPGMHEAFFSKTPNFFHFAKKFVAKTKKNGSSGKVLVNRF